MSYRHRQTILIPRLTPEEFQALRGCCFVLVGALSASIGLLLLCVAWSFSQPGPAPEMPADFPGTLQAQECCLLEDFGLRPVDKYGGYEPDFRLAAPGVFGVYRFLWTL
jgi:hypothetical protein